MTHKEAQEEGIGGCVKHILLKWKKEFSQEIKIPREL